MATPDADDASPSPEYRSDLDDENDMAAEQKTDDSSPSQKTNGQKANAKDPLRPRRKKARRACFACQRAHLTCGEYHLHTRNVSWRLQDFMGHIQF
mgnify:CR=1 FL=1|tara:strand:- start:13377 stop:13664 length:288 start_codon:yes stop_codon:yes gene_type:complete